MGVLFWFFELPFSLHTKSDFATFCFSRETMGGRKGTVNEVSDSISDVYRQRTSGKLTSKTVSISRKVRNTPLLSPGPPPVSSHRVETCLQGRLLRDRRTAILPMIPLTRREKMGGGSAGVLEVFATSVNFCAGPGPLTLVRCFRSLFPTQGPRLHIALS